MGLVEAWLPIPGNENYAVSSLGRIRRDKPGKGTRAGKLRKICVLPNGYEYIDMWEEGFCTRLYVHQVVALAFIGPQPTPAHEVAHWDGVRTNNVFTNLRWATPKENKSDTHRHGTHLEGQDCTNAKLTDEQVLEIRILRNQGWTLQKLSDHFGVVLTNIGLICQGKTWKHLKLDYQGNTQVRLTKEDVIEIRGQLATGAATRHELANKYKVCYSTISHIFTRRIWKDV